MTSGKRFSQLSDEELSTTLFEVAVASCKQPGTSHLDEKMGALQDQRVPSRPELSRRREMSLFHSASLDLLRRDIFPVIRNRGLWDKFHDLLAERWHSSSSPTVQFSEFLLLGISTRELAEVCFIVLSIEDPRLTALKAEIEELGLDPEY